MTSKEFKIFCIGKKYFYRILNDDRVENEKSMYEDGGIFTIGGEEPKEVKEEEE